jgi:antitoxin VapB
MNAPRKSRTFKSGNSEAVRLPKGLGFGIGTEVLVERRGDELVLRAASNPDTEKAAVRELVRRLREIGRPDDGVQARPDFEAPERPGL